MNQFRAPVSVWIAAGALALNFALPAAPQKSGPAKERLVPIFSFPRQTIVFEPTRNDVTVGSAVFSLYFARPADLVINGQEADATWREIRIGPSGNIIVEKRGANRQSQEAWIYIRLSKAAENRFYFGPLNVELRERSSRALLCMSIKAWFTEIANEHDGPYYERLEDRYALASFCTSTPDQTSVIARFSQSRVATVGEFKETLGRPLVIRLNQRPLPGKDTSPQK